MHNTLKFFKTKPITTKPFMEKKFSVFLIVGIVLFLLVLFAGFLVVNTFGKPNQSAQSSTPVQNPSSPINQNNPTPVGSEEANNQTATPSLDPYPAPTEIIVTTPTTEPIVVLPPLPSYPTPGPFKNMRVIYTQLEKPGYWINNIDGNEEKKLTGWWSTTENAIKYAQLTFTPSPSGEYLLFSAWDNINIYKNEPDANSFWVNKLDGSEPLVKVTANELWFPENPIWSPDGKQIAYRRTYKNKSETGDLITGKGFEIWIMNVDGSEEKQIFSDPNLWVTIFGGDLPLFQWLYNGYIYFAVNDPGTLYAVNPIDGTSYKLLDTINSIQWRLSLSPDGLHVRQSMDVPVGLIKQAGLVPAEVPFSYQQPIWSADGKKIVYLETDANERDKAVVVLHDLINGNKQEVLKLKAKDQLLGFSPDDRYIAYKDETEALYVFDLTTNTSTLMIQGQSQQGGEIIRFDGWLPVP